MYDSTSSCSGNKILCIQNKNCTYLIFQVHLAWTAPSCNCSRKALKAWKALNPIGFLSRLLATQFKRSIFGGGGGEKEV